MNAKGLRRIRIREGWKARREAWKAWCARWGYIHFEHWVHPEFRAMIERPAQSE